MPVFTAIGAAIFGAGTFLAGATAFALSTAASMALNYAAKALAGNRDEPAAAKADGFSAQGTLQAGGDVPRSFNLGYSITAGSLVYMNTWGADGETPNAYMTQVIAINDVPGADLLRVWVNGELCTIDGSVSIGLGNPVLEYRKGGVDHLWVKYYDGTQTTADSTLVNVVSSVDRPWPSSRVGYGVAYAICSALVEDALFTGVPTFRFELSGLPLYDPSKDSTVGGSGSHRWSDRSTWGGDGDHLPAVQIYNILRGITYDGKWIYGLQNLTAARLPTTNWIAQINKCREEIQGEGGMEPTYRSGLQINVDTQPANAIETLLTACQGRVSEIGGFYKIHLGAPGSPTFSFTDADILSTEAQNFTPFFPLADSINGITASYPNPDEAWNTKAAPPIYRTDLETRDGGRRLLANPSFDAVPYSAQVQRLMKSARDEAQRARRHTMVMPPAFWLVEPGDVGAWTSTRSGYDGKLFRVDGVVDEPNLDVSWNITEVDPSDYDWDFDEDFTPVFSGPTIFPRPAPQGIVDWLAEPWSVKDDDGFLRRPAIRLSWDGDMPGVSGVRFAIRHYDSDAGDYVVVHRGRTDYLEAGAIIISQNLLPKTDYQAQGEYIPTAPRDMLPSDWLDVTTPDIRVQAADLEDYIVDQVTKVTSALQDELDGVKGAFDVLKNEMSRNWNDKKEHRGQVSSQFGKSYAEIDDVRTTAVDTQTAFASFTTTVTATFGSLNAQVTQNSSAIATLNGITAAKWSVTTTVNGHVAGVELLNGGGGVSSFTVLADKFQVAQPGFAGGAVVPIFTIATVGGAPKLAFRGDMIGDGSITVSKLNVVYLTSISARFGDAVVDGTLSGATQKMVLSFTSDNLIISD